MVHYVAMYIGLAIYWLLLSGHFETQLLAFGVVSCGLVVWLVHRMDVIDHEAQPYGMGVRTMVYLPWLLWEIVKANIDVARVILDPKLPISPTIFETDTYQKTELGRVIYANSITLTPGTVTIDIDGNGRFLIHALTRAGAEGVLTRDMDRRVAALESKSSTKETG